MPVHNYRSGIDMILSGTEGVDYAVETRFSDPVTFDDEVVFIKAATTISFGRNARYTSGKDGANWYYKTVGAGGPDGTPGSGDDGVIRYWLDCDLGYYHEWARYYAQNATAPAFTDRAATVGPAYSSPISFASLTYVSPNPQAGTAVLGSTGNNGQAITSRSTFVQYGHLDSFGDEIHDLAHWGDNSDAAARAGDGEWWTGDGKVRRFIVNPKTPCLTFGVTGSGKFYTTPLKHYHTPKIFIETTYAESTWSVNLRNIMSSDHVFYAINTNPTPAGATFIDGGSNNVILTSSDFATGTRYLHYYYNGTYKKTRKIVNNPTHPSTGETHGMLLFGTSLQKSRFVSSVVNAGEYWWTRYINGNSAQRGLWDSLGNSGQRYSPYMALVEALLADQRGLTDAQSGQQSHALYAKQMLMQNMQRIDPVGAGSPWSENSIPCRELYYRGYYDSYHVRDLAFGYDTLIAIFKSTHHATGITPVEDYYLRDLLARPIWNDIAYNAGIYRSNSGLAIGGMWDVARRCAAVACAMALPSYNTPYYGVSGFDGQTGGYEWAPFRDDRLTWKQVYIDNNATLSGFPNYSSRLGIEEYNCRADGVFLDRPVYFGNMGYEMSIGGTLIRRLDNTKTFPGLEACLLNAINGTLTGTKGSDPPQRYILPPGYNASFPSAATAGVAWINANPTHLKRYVESAGNAPYSWGFYDSRYGLSSSAPLATPPAGAYESARSVVLTNPNPAASIYYTTNGSTPSNASTLYSGPISVPATATIKSISYEPSLDPSPVLTSAYVIDASGKPAAPSAP